VKEADYNEAEPTLPSVAPAEAGVQGRRRSDGTLGSRFRGNDGWQRNPLGVVCEVINGGTPKTGVPGNWGGNHLWITPAEMGNRINPYVDDTNRKITDSGLRNSSAQMLPPHSVILSSRAPIGHLVINTKPMATNQGCKGLVPGSHLYHKFLYYYLSGIVELLNSLGTGATFKELSSGKLKDVTIPIPPLPEQRRIVGILDEAFAGIATAKANAEKNLKNARALFDSHLQSVFTQRDERWVEKPFEDCIEDVKYTKKIQRKEFLEDDKFPIISQRLILSMAIGTTPLMFSKLPDRW
jgi:type I restriction enzyme, S subunit